MRINNSIDRKFKWYLLSIIVAFIAILVLSLSAAGAVVAREDRSFTDTQKVTKTESTESSTLASSYSAGLTVRCNVILDK